MCASAQVHTCYVCVHSYNCTKISVCLRACGGWRWAVRGGGGRVRVTGSQCQAGQVDCRLSSIMWPMLILTNHRAERLWLTHDITWRCMCTHLRLSTAWKSHFWVDLCGRREEIAFISSYTHHSKVFLRFKVQLCSFNILVNCEGDRSTEAAD